MRAKDGNGNKTYIFDRSETYQYDSSCARKMAAEFQSKEDILIFANCNTADHSIQLNILVFVFSQRRRLLLHAQKSLRIYQPALPLWTRTSQCASLTTKWWKRMDWGWCVRISWRRGWVSAVCCVLVTHLTRKMKNLVRDTLAVVLLMVCFKNIWRLCSPCWRWENYCSCSADISWKRSKHPEQSRGKLNKSILRQSLSIRTSINRSLVRLSLMFGQ